MAKSKKNGKKKNQSVVDHLVNNLEYAREGILEATRSQAALAHRAGEYKVEQMRKRIEAKANLAMVEADVSAKFRQSYLEDSAKNPTQRMVEEALEQSGYVREARQELVDATISEEYAKSLSESYYQRAMMIQVESRLVGSEEGHV